MIAQKVSKVPDHAAPWIEVSDDAMERYRCDLGDMLMMVTR